ncbi:hypothetical protein FB566_0739 [Stackebrandtia endophytica]|uniref:MFS transporter n=1 Tax=Stackebrandtia endophytica TaxID=1496996 RepID=A0A543ARN2_9ACTN|nr:hypothetical protein [Stackebrandtia endophytica]TQL75242.1 hypothetical protein FB566_0739 [Stackebrandtia endophytica]
MVDRTRLPSSRYLAGSFLARLAEEGMAVAIALLALERTGSAGPAALLMAAWLVPHILVAPLVGRSVRGFVARPGFTRSS